MRTRILNAARMLFVEYGYDAVTMRAIAKKIEYSPTTIYLHFKDKEDLIQELCTQDFLALSRSFQRIARVADPVERLRRLGRAYAEFGLRNPNHYRLMFMTPHPPFGPDEKDVEKGNPEQDGYAFLKYTIAECMRTKRFRSGMTDVELIAQTHWAGIHGVISLEIAKRNDE
ncbi:MAG TPA: TetR/AcrR family transcriptional regulator, partial [Burkholderiales bacterium]|nr:TetR/AcrR family transcriptional regulator [Burkholderiales bacterium]